MLNWDEVFWIFYELVRERWYMGVEVEEDKDYVIVVVKKSFIRCLIL